MQITPYWEHPRTQAKDVAGRLDHILTNDITGIPFDKPCVVADFVYVKQMLVDQNDNKVRPFVMFERTRTYEPDDVCVSLQSADDIYSIFVAYPIRALSGGGLSATKLEDVRTAIYAGFTGWQNGRSFPTMIKGIRWHEVDQSWGIMEIQVTVPYNTGNQDNPEIFNRTGDDLNAICPSYTLSAPIQIFNSSSSTVRQADITAPASVDSIGTNWRLVDSFGKGNENPSVSGPVPNGQIIRFAMLTIQYQPELLTISGLTQVTSRSYQQNIYARTDREGETPPTPTSSNVALFSPATTVWELSDNFGSLESDDVVWRNTITVTETLSNDDYVPSTNFRVGTSTQVRTG